MMEVVSPSRCLYTSALMSRHHQAELRLESKRIDEEELVSYLNDGARHPVAVVFTRNRISMVTVRFAPDGSVNLRLHRAFLDASPAVHKALRTYLRLRRRAAWQTVSTYARSIGAEDHGARSRPCLSAVGRVHDLGQIAKDVNAQFFNGKVKCRVGWGRRYRGRRSRRSTSIRYGSWDASTRTARVNPILDDERVPAVFVRYIVFHEMLHAVVPHEAGNGRRQHHTRQFKAIEKTFPDLDRMKQYSTDLLDALV